MKYTKLAALLICGLLASPVFDGNAAFAQFPGGRPGNNGFGNGGGNFSPGGRPVNQLPGNFNPGNNPGPGINPGPANNPGPGINNIPFGVPNQPLMPASQPFTPPAPPVQYTPYAGSLFGSLLGLAIGTTINLSLNSLVNSGYNVSSYGPNTIYLTDVTQLGLLWPNATLYYSDGSLSASRFVYSTPFFNQGRYMQAYNALVANYGSPVQSNSYASGAQTASWWGNNGQYITLQFKSETAANGSLRYYTILTYGS